MNINQHFCLHPTASNREEHHCYFRTLSQLLNLRIIALGETPIALLKGNLFPGRLQDAGPSLRGLTSDIYVAPYNLVGEDKLPLINSPEGLATIFEPGRKIECQKKALFYSFTHLYGKKSLSDEYKIAADKILSPHDAREKLVENLLWFDLIAYFQRLEECLGDDPPPVLVFYLKFYFYRPLAAFLDTIALQMGRHPSSPWELVALLREHHYINQKEEQQLHKIIDEIGIARLKTFFYYDKTRAQFYLKDKPQDENLLKYYDEKHLKKVLEAILLLQFKVCPSLQRSYKCLSK